MRKYLILVTFLVVSVFGAAALACGDPAQKPVGDGATGTNNDFTKEDGKLKVATTVAPLTSLLLQIGGDRIDIHGLIPDGVNSHTFEPRPSDAKIMARADIFIMNGAHLEGTTEEIAKQNLKDPSKIYKLADNTLSGEDEKTGFLYDFSFPKAEGSPNPHLWMNPKYALKYAQLMSQWLGENDAKNKPYFEQNLATLTATLNALDVAIRADAATVPAPNRKLLTYHDSWAYWAREYGWVVIGAIQPSDFSEPSAKEVTQLIDQIKKEKVPVVFGSEVFPSTVLKQIAGETGAKFEDHLSDDAPPGKIDGKDHTYVGMLVENMRIMFTSLGGNADATAKIPAANGFAR